MPTPRPPRSIPRLQIARVFGVPVYLAATWGLFVLFVVGLYGPILHDRGNSWTASVLLGLVLAVLWGLSVLAHELGHVYVAKAMGTTVFRVEIGLLGGLTETASHDERPREEFWVSVVGPLVSIALAVPGLISLLLGTGLGFGAAGNLGLLLATFTLSNLIVGVFNLLPGLPLDGGHLLVAVVWHLRGSRQTGIRTAAVTGQLLSAAGAALGVVLAFQGRGWWFQAAIALLLSWSLWDLARSSYRQSLREERLDSTGIEDLIVPAGTAQVAASVAQVRERNGPADTVVLVDADQRPVALIHTAVLQGREDASGPVADSATALDERQLITETTSLLALADLLRDGRFDTYVVLAADGTVIGTLSAESARSAPQWQNAGEPPG